MRLSGITRRLPVDEDIMLRIDADAELEMSLYENGAIESI